MMGWQRANHAPGGGCRALLVGGGHAHLAALDHLARHPCPALALTLVTRSRWSLYSGLLPAVIRGEIGAEAARIDCAAVARRAGAALVVAEAAALAPSGVRLEGGAWLEADLVSLDLGGRTAPLPGAIPVRPIDALLAHLMTLDGGAGPVAVIGGGPAGVELALALARRWSGRDLALVMRSREPLPSAPPPVRAGATAALRRAGIGLHVGATAVAAEDGQLLLADGRVLPAHAALCATGAIGPALLAGSGLALDARGCVRVDAAWRSVSHGSVLAAGDCAANPSAPRPKGGVWAVRAGRPLAETLRAVAEHRPPPMLPMQRDALAILGLGRGRALAWRGGWHLEGRAAWWRKQALDRAWIARLR